MNYNNLLANDNAKISTGFIVKLKDIANLNGICVDDFITDAGISYQQLSDTNGWFPAKLLEKIVISIHQSTTDELIALKVGQKTAITKFGVLGFLLETSLSLSSSISLIQTYERLVSDIGTTSLSFSPGVALLSWECKTEDKFFEKISSEFIISCLSKLLERIKFSDFSALIAVNFKHAAPESADLVFAYHNFFGCPVYFNQPNSGLVILSKALDIQLNDGNIILQETLEQLAKKLLAERTRQLSDSVIYNIKNVLRILFLQGSVNAEKLAEHLAISTRTLHRILQQEGVNYRYILDEIRYEIACQYLRSQNYSVEQVSEKLLFESSQSFIRWFRKHTNVTPKQFQNNILSNIVVS